jgi:2-C-methyl-D-erythritol 4-phosphate cytidylyltransferase
MKALEALPAECTHVAVHDAARPLGTSAMVERVVSAARTHPAVVPAVRVAATLKRVFQDPSHDGGELKRLRDHYEPVERVLAEGEDAEATGEHDLPVVVETIDRRGVWAAQTPQVFDAELLREVYGRVASGRLSPAGVTDDASLIELAGGTEVVLVEGEATNLKITEPGDAELAEAIVRMRDAEALAEAKDPLADLFDDEP